MSKYRVTTYFHTKGWRNGDLEDDYQLISVKDYKTRKLAKSVIERQLTGKNIQRNYHKGDKPSRCYSFTGLSWIHENTGEKMDEYYEYILTKES